MRTIFFIPLLLITTALIFSGNASAVTYDYGEDKAVYDVNYDDSDRHTMVLRNIQNHVNALGVDNIQVKVVLSGDGLSLLNKAKDDDDLRANIDNLKMQNVRFLVCNNTLEGRQISLHDDLYDASEEDVVVSGNAHISYLQRQGYTFLKP
ncbi:MULTISPECIES: DsrE family protein [unclassified Thioalkalivibrio]|uniref:DsrE family protein n=1 Tax=unclassified Thioalkalivibrio TaxID=2621013 RepID=UPI0003791A0E|nr:MULTISPECIES: DsrE family protein [unclassified Thioalkalivibrio]